MSDDSLVGLLRGQTRRPARVAPRCVDEFSAAEPRDRDYKLADGDGLHLLVRSNGSKLWRFRYWFLGKENMLSFGKFPDVSVEQARKKRDECRRMLTDGFEPSFKRSAVPF